MGKCTTMGTTSEIEEGSEQTLGITPLYVPFMFFSPVFSEEECCIFRNLIDVAPLRHTPHNTGRIILIENTAHGKHM